RGAPPPGPRGQLIEIPLDPNVHLGPITLAWHGIFTAVGIFFGVWLPVRLLRPYVNEDAAYGVATVAVISGILGARLGHLLDPRAGAPRGRLRPRMGCAERRRRAVAPPLHRQMARRAHLLDLGGAVRHRPPAPRFPPREPPVRADLRIRSPSGPAHRSARHRG